MNKFIWFDASRLARFDPTLTSDEYQFNDWFQPHEFNSWPQHLQSRSRSTVTPWGITSTILPLPKFETLSDSFDQVIEGIAHDFLLDVRERDLKIFLCWSGGIDSTAILVSLLKVMDNNDVSRLTILLNKNSITENPYFYHTFIKGKIREENINMFFIDGSNYDKIVLLDGEAGNQIHGSVGIYNLIISNRAELLDHPWRDDMQKLKNLIGPSKLIFSELTISANTSPISIDTYYDLLWWANFDLKFDDVLIRKTISYTKNLNPEQCQLFYKNHLFRFFAQDSMQQWSMNTHVDRKIYATMDSKYYFKEYIHKFDQNDFYWNSRHQLQGAHNLSFDPTLIAIDDSWHKYYITDGEFRKSLGKLLKRN